MVRADFEHRTRVPLLQLQQGVRDADVVVETCLAPQRRPALAEDGGDEILRRRLPVRAADGDDGNVEVLPVASGELGVGSAGIRDGDDGRCRRLAAAVRSAGSIRRRLQVAGTGLLHHHGCDSLRGDLGDELVPVELVSGNRDEQVARLH